MTTQDTSREPGRESGEVFDLGYQHYEGPREGRKRARIAVYSEGLRMSLGVGRGGKAKIVPWLFIIAAAIPAFVMALIAGTIDRIAPGAGEMVDLPTHGDYYGIASIILLVFSASVGPELLCPDRRSGVINLYLVRPITTTDYVFARWLAFVTVMTLVVWFPQFVLLIGLALSDPDTFDYVKDNWSDVPRFLAAGLALSVFTSSIALAVASFTNRRAYATAFIIGLYFLSLPVVGGLTESLDVKYAKYIALFNLGEIPIYINDIVFGEVSMVTEDSKAKALSDTVLASWYAVATLIPIAVMWNKYRKFTP
jgi:ABC-2 type transport system permease protein